MQTALNDDGIEHAIALIVAAASIQLPWICRRDLVVRWSSVTSLGRAFLPSLQ
jgi:hypothetical protein